MISQINEFIESSISNVNSYEQAHAEYQKIRNYLNDNNFDIHFNDALILLNNNKKLKKIIELYFNKFKTLLDYFELEYIFDDINLMSLIEGYMSIIKYEIVDKTDDETIENNYFNEMRKIPLLNKEQEIILAKKMEEGDMLARKLFIESNLRFVVSIARRYQDFGLELEDLIEEGNIGLIEAVDNFDYTKGYKFSTYARSWIRKEIINAINTKGRIIKIPTRKLNSLNNFINNKKTIEDEAGRVLSPAELANKMNLSIDKVKEYMSLIEQGKIISINDKLGDNSSNSSTEICDIISNGDQSTEDKIESLFFNKEINDLINSVNLTEIEKEVIILRMGLNGCERLTFDQIAKMKGTSRAYINIVEKKALNKIRLSSFVDKFLVYANNPNLSQKNLKDSREEFSKINVPKLNEEIIYTSDILKIIIECFLSKEEKEILYKYYDIELNTLKIKKDTIYNIDSLKKILSKIKCKLKELELYMKYNKKGLIKKDEIFDLIINNLYTRLVSSLNSELNTRKK